jgi:acetyltransferase-like isoleucine patch superfamily enzyme
MAAPFVHPAGLCESQHVGEDTRIWAFAHVLPGARIGRNCNICDGVFIENDVRVGDDVTVKSGVQLWDGVRIGNRVFIGPNATFTNDPFPRSKHYPEKFATTTIEDGASIGANATILPGITVGFEAMIGAGAVVVHDVPARAIVVGNPGRVVGYSGAADSSDSADSSVALPADFPAKIIRLPKFDDARGRLTVAEHAALPFRPARFFLVDKVPPGAARGAHAHRRCHQVLISLAGSLTAIADDGRRAFAMRLDAPDVGLYLPSLLWGMQFRYSSDAVLLVLASEAFDRSDYISDYRAFLAEGRASHAPSSPV